MKDFLKYVASVVCAVVLATALVVLPSCTGAQTLLVKVGVPAAASAGGIAYWVFNQPWAAKICYWIADEAALRVMQKCPATADKDVIAFCGEGIAYLQTAQGLDAATINAQLATALVRLPPNIQADFQEAATILDEFLPPATATVALTSAQINDIVGFLKGWQDGTTTCLDELPASLLLQEAQEKATRKVQDLRAKHPAKLKAVKGGWFVPPATVTK